MMTHLSQPDAEQPQRHPLDGLAIRAAFDWLDFKVKLASPSQFRHVQERARPIWGTLYIKPLERPESCREFQIRAHDPEGPNQFMRNVQALVAPGDPPIDEADIEIVGVEIAIDGYLQANDPQALALAAHHFMRSHARLPAGPPRVTAPGHSQCVESPRDALHALQSAAATVNQGQAPTEASEWQAATPGDNHRSRYYVKCHDTRDGEAYALLPLDQHRARMEITLSSLNSAQPSRTPFTTVEQWRHFQFASLSSDLALVRPTTPTSALSAQMQHQTIQFGMRPDAPTGRPDDRRMSWSFTRRDTAMNARIRDALRALTRAQGCGN